MKIGILGTGMIVKDLLTVINELSFESISLLGTEDTREETLELVSRYGLNNAFFDYDEMLSSDIDTVYVALPNHLHFNFAQKALLAGKHAIIEKPVVLRSSELLTLTQIAEEKRCLIFEAMNIHYLPAFTALKQRLSDIGNVKIVSLNYSQYSSRYDGFMQGILHPAFDPARGGGAMMDINVYNLHLVLGLFGRPLSFSYTPNIQNHVDTSGMLVMNYPGFKAVCIGAKDCQAPTHSTLQGDKGCIVLGSPPNTLTGFKIKFNSGEWTESETHSGHRLLPEFREFIRIVDQADVGAAAQHLMVSLVATEILETISKQITMENNYVS